MHNTVVSDRQEAPDTSIMVMEQKLSVAVTTRNHGRLPMRAGELQSEAGDYSPPFNQRYYSR